MTVHRPAGITLLDLLVVLVIIAALMRLLMPAIQSAHTGRRRTECANNLGNLALAAVHDEFANRELPGYLHEFGPGGRDPPEPLGSQPPVGTHAKIGTWAVTLMPYLDAQATYEPWTEDE